MLVTPGSTTMRWLARSTSTIRLIRLSEIRIPSATGVAPPDSPEPAPRATHGTPARWQARTTACTSSVEPGSTAADGRHRVLEQAVGLVGAQLVLVGYDVLGADRGAQLRDQRGR